MSATKDAIRRGAAELNMLLTADPMAAGAVVRVHGEHLILHRECDEIDDGEAVLDDHVRCTRLDAAALGGLGVKRHNGRPERADSPVTSTSSSM